MSAQAGWILQAEVVPRLRATIPRVPAVGCEDAEELVQDATAIAAKMLHGAEAAGRTVTPGNVAYYAVQHIKSGRRSTGSSVVDAMASRTQLNGTRLHSLGEVVVHDDGGEVFELEDVLGNDHEDPATEAARRLDWASFLAGLSHIEQLVIEFMSAGRTLRELARQVGLSDSTMQGYRRRIAAKILEFMGADVLRDIVQVPGWRISLDCERAAQACRHCRAHA